MCETRDLGFKWPHWHTLIFNDEIRIDLRFVCPRDVKNDAARSVYWKKWAAKHEHEELKEGAWLEPGLALLRKKVKETWTEKHRNVARKIFLERGWTQKRLFDIGWSDVSQCQSSLPHGGRHKEAQALPLSRMVRSQTGDSRESGSKPRQEFPLHLPSPAYPIMTRFESGFCLLCTPRGPCCLSPYHQVWEVWLCWILSALCGGIWVCSWE